MFSLPCNVKYSQIRREDGEMEEGEMLGQKIESFNSINFGDLAHTTAQCLWL